MWPQWASIPLQGLDRCILTVMTMSGLHSHLRLLHWHDFVSGEFTIVDKKHCGITDQLTLASEGSEHAL